MWYNGRNLQDHDCRRFPDFTEDLAEVIREQPDMEVVREASTGKEIVALAENMDYDLILMDIEMETMNAGITGYRNDP